MDNIQMQFSLKLDKISKSNQDERKLHIKTNDFYLNHFSVKPLPDHVIMYNLERKMARKKKYKSL